MKLYRVDAPLATKLRGRADVARVIHDVLGRDHALMSEATFRHLGGKVAASEETLDPGALEELESRLIRSWRAQIGEALPAGVRREALVYLLANPAAQLEIMGRGQYTTDQHLPGDPSRLVWLDIPGGRRSYLFRLLDSEVGEPDARIRAVTQAYESYRAWVNEPDTRLVLSIGGGGWRLFGATGVVRLLDHLLESRTQVDEVWGCSGGALLGYVFAHGYDPNVVDELGFDLYHSRGKTHLANGSITASLRAHARDLRARWKGEDTPPAISHLMARLDHLQPVSERLPERIPYFAQATNTRNSDPAALTQAEHIPDYCRDFLFPCTAENALAASTTVPFLLPPMRGITGANDDTWVDGSVTEENPIALPFMKWMRDRRHFPDTTPKRLKILSIQLNLRASEFGPLERLNAMPVVKHVRALKHATRLMDALMDSKTAAPLQMLSVMPEVEVMRTNLALGWLGFMSHRQIPRVVRSGRSIDRWTTTLHGGRFAARSRGDGA